MAAAPPRGRRARAQPGTRPELDPEAHTKLVDELEAVVNRALELQGDSANRGADSQEEAAELVRSELAILYFRRAEPTGK